MVPLDVDEDRWKYRIPTCVAAFDSIIHGGVPVGSLVLLLGEIGAGQTEFAYTSAAKLALAKTKPNLRTRIFGGYFKNISIPDKICYVSFTKSERDILREVSISFNEEYYQAFKENLVFKDFSKMYFRHSIVPPSWSSRENSFFTQDNNSHNLLEELINFLDQNGKGNLVIIDSLTDLLISPNIETDKLLSILKGLQRVSKEWDGMIYMILTKDVTPPLIEKAISDITDGLLVFDWYKSSVYSRRQRYMYVGKFIGVLPHLDQARIARFMTDISGRSGFVVANSERIM